MRRVILAVVLAAVADVGPFRAQGAWPNTTVWPTSVSDDTYAVKGSNGLPIRDLNADQSPVPLDVSSHGTAAAGDWNSAYLYFDNTNLFFRLLLNADPGTAGSFDQFAWLAELDVNLDNTADWLVGVDGVAEIVTVKCLASTTETIVGATTAYARSVNTTVASLSNKSSNMFYIDWQVPLTSLNDGAGGCPDMAANTVVKAFFGTSASYAQVNKDYFTGASVNFSDMGYFTATNPGGTTSTGVPVR